LKGRLPPTFHFISLMTREPSYREWIARSLARALLADARQPGATAPNALRARAEATLGADPPWLKLLADELGKRSLATWQRTDLPGLAKAIHDMPALELAFEQDELPRVRRLILRPADMLPRPMGLDDCALPDLPTLADLAQWLELEPDRLAWLTAASQAFREPGESSARPASHYRYQLQPKRLGGLRLLEIPKADLKRVAAPHPRWSLAACARARSGPWLRAGPLGREPRGGTRRQGDRDRLRPARFLSQRSRIARACAVAHAGLPRRRGTGAHFGATYTRYADDLVFSGSASLRGQFTALRAWVDGIAADEGFALHPRKVRCMPQHHQQRVTGVVVNQKANTPRTDFDRLKAVLHQCAVHGPASQNRAKVADFRGHLLGHIAWIGQFNPTRKARLMRLFDRIEWQSAAQPSG
jgi:hypothetical protein